MNKIELILHPIRMRIVLALVNQTLTAQQIAAQLPDVAQTTLYRHINLLIEDDVVAVVSESKVRGTLERELTLIKDAARIDLETLTKLPPAEQAQYFIRFVSMLLADFDNAQNQPLENFPAAIYRRQRIYATIEELNTIEQQTNDALLPYQHKTENTYPWLITGIIMPDTSNHEEPNT